ncbi:cytochrome P450 [Absidia repens]|uniref:Cytochrome P450 n=1 Tax=Absidia repens TaxID=90262 RepID=A0A1X2IKJ0_9FUNG|nr:cytochrome P450 [Absidia repens]
MSSFTASAFTTSTVGKVAFATATALVAYYNDRAIFDENRVGMVNYRGLPLVGNLPLLIQNKDKIYDMLLETYHQHKALTITFSVLGIPRQILTLDPRNVEYLLKGPDFHNAMNDLFGNGIFNANGDEWKYQRKTASHVFNVKNFRDQFTDVFIEEIHYMMNNIWDKAVETQTAIDFHEIMFKFTLDSFILLGFGVHLNALGTKGKVPFAESFDEAQRTTFQRFITPLWSVTEFLGRIAQPFTTSMKDHLKVVDGFARQVTEQRREQLKNGEQRRREPLSNDELRDIVLNFVIAGRDTTAQALSWTFYMLMSHPRVEVKLLEEINANITEEALTDSALLYETIKDMKYAHAIFYEVLRLYPSVPLNQKEALKDDVFPDGSIIRKGDNILWCPYAQGRVEDIWGADAKQFKPERWINENGDLKRESQGKWPAFHGGRQHLATLEALVAIIFLVRKYKFTLVPGQDITYQVSLTLPMRNGMKVMVEKR